MNLENNQEDLEAKYRETEKRLQEHREHRRKLVTAVSVIVLTLGIIWILTRPSGESAGMFGWLVIAGVILLGGYLATRQEETTRQKMQRDMRKYRR